MWRRFIIRPWHRWMGITDGKRPDILPHASIVIDALYEPALHHAHCKNVFVPLQDDIFMHAFEIDGNRH